MTLPECISKQTFTNSLLIGFYGGGNYGDELLMEVLAGLLKKRGAKNVHIAYQHPERYKTYHHDFGYTRIDMHDKKAVLKAVFKKKEIVVGGGGLWGLDCNFNVLLMSIMLFVCRWLLRKKVYLLAVGYYNSAPAIGRVSAWLAGKAANVILARDQESYQNFAKINKNTEQCSDIAWHIDELDLAPYEPDLALLERSIHVSGETLFMTLRRFHGANKHHLAAVVGECLRSFSDKSIIIALLEPRHIDPQGYSLLESWKRAHPNVQIIDFAFNPLALFLFFKKYREQLLFVGPQFHAILSAHLTGVPYLPVAYDNKVHNLLQAIAPGQKPIALQALQPETIQSFIAGTRRKAA